MNKTKIILAAVGGVIGLALIATAAFAYLAYDSKTEAADELETVLNKARSLASAKIYPGEASVKELTMQRERLADWQENALAVVRRGDQPLMPTTDAAFKEFLGGDARRLTQLPAGTTNKIVDASFAFGPFKPYIAEGQMPPAAELERLQREWGDIALLLETMVACGVEKVTDILVTGAKKEEPKVDEKPKKGARRNAKKAEKKEVKALTAQESYQISGLASPAAFVRVLNALATGPRYTVVEEFGFHRTKDSIVEALAGKEKSEESATSSRRGRRNRAAEAEEAEKKDEPLYTFVTNPSAEATMQFTLKVTIHDFRSLEEPKEEEESK